MTERKTQRKNRTNLVMKWPSKDEYFTIPSLWKGLNPDFIEITLRVRLKKAIEEEKTVAEIGSKNMGFGRPIKIFAMTPVSPTVLEKAKNDGVILNSPSVPVVQINSNTPLTVVTPTTPVTNVTTPTTTVAS